MTADPDKGTSPGAGRPQDARAAEVRLSVWSFLWASAILFSLTSNAGWFIFLSTSFPSTAWFREAALASLALATMLRPGWLPLLSLLALVQLAQVAELLPEVANHRLITGFVNLSLVVAVLETCRGERTLRPSAAGFWERFLPVGRWLLLAVYLFAFFAKLNADFLDPGASCATQFYAKIAYWLPILPQGNGAGAAVVWSTVIVEGALPLLLAIPRSRTSGVVLGIAFHLALSFDLLQHLVNFSAVMFALLVLFLPDRTFLRLADHWEHVRGKTATSSAVRTIACVSFLALMVIALHTIGNDAFAPTYYSFRQVMLVAYGLVLIVAAVAFVDNTAAERVRLPRTAMQTAILILAVVNGLSPYLGLKTRTSFNMYSNLRVEADGSNHFLVPRSLDLLGFLSDTVVVLRTNDAALWSQAAGQASRITWFEFTSHVNRTPDIEVLYRRNGTVRYLNSREGIGMPPPPPLLLRKLLFLRSVGDDVARECLW